MDGSTQVKGRRMVASSRPAYSTKEDCQKNKTRNKQQQQNRCEELEKGDKEKGVERGN